MLRILAWVAAACVVVVLVLAMLRGRGAEPQRIVVPVPQSAAPAQAAEPPAAEPGRVDAPPALAITPTEPDLQVQEDAAAVGMTTREPEAGSEPAAETPPN